MSDLDVGALHSSDHAFRPVSFALDRGHLAQHRQQRELQTKSQLGESQHGTDRRVRYVPAL